MIGVLHTWGRNLAYHPHLHYLVPAGALTDDQKAWRPVRHPFFLPVRVLSRIFRRNLQEALRGTSCYVRIPASVWQQEWVVHCEPVGSGVGALKYLAPYIFRVAISNNRILKVDKDCVTFRYRATETGAERLCTLGAEEFIHRFLQHVLPKGFVKVRYYGFFSLGCRNKLATLRQQFQDNPASLLFPAETSDTCLPANSIDAPTAYPRCPVCGCSMRPGPFLPPMEHSPPWCSYLWGPMHHFAFPHDVGSIVLTIPFVPSGKNFGLLAWKLALSSPFCFFVYFSNAIFCVGIRISCKPHSLKFQMILLALRSA
jgi:hypothetical protein